MRFSCEVSRKLPTGSVALLHTAFPGGEEMELARFECDNSSNHKCLGFLGVFFEGSLLSERYICAASLMYM